MQWDAMGEKEKEEDWIDTIMGTFKVSPADFIMGIEEKRAHVVWTGWPLLCSDKEMIARFPSFWLPQPSESLSEDMKGKSRGFMGESI